MKRSRALIVMLAALFAVAVPVCGAGPASGAVASQPAAQKLLVVETAALDAELGVTRGQMAAAEHGAQRQMTECLTSALAQLFEGYQANRYANYEHDDRLLTAPADCLGSLGYDAARW